MAIGTIASLQSWTRVVAPYAWSWLGDHWHRGTHRVELLRIATRADRAGVAGPVWLRDFTAVALVVFLIYLANGAVMPLSEATVTQRLTSDKGLDVGRYGRVRVWGSLGFIIAVSAVRRAACKAPASRLSWRF